MNLFILNYDVTDNSQINDEEFKEKVTEFLAEQDVANPNSYVKSSITFTSYKAFTVLQKAFDEFLFRSDFDKIPVYYQICEVASSMVESDVDEEFHLPNPSLSKNYVEKIVPKYFKTF